MKNSDAGKKFKGIISVTARGTGYVPLEGFEKDIEIPFENLNTALNGDMVEARLVKTRGDKRQQGEVVEILERDKTQFVGTIERDEEGFFLVSDDRRMYADISTKDAEKKRIKEGTKALVEITRWEKGDEYPEGAVLRTLGMKGEHETEMQAIVLGHEFDTSFPKEVEKEAKEINDNRKITDEEINKRRDFRDTPTFTIDPDDAKDFDDALSVKTLPNGNIEVGIHIADVTHYVRPGSEVDKEAQKRGTSVYLVDRTIPMLPEILSNDICSLKPDEDRLTFSAVFTLDSSGEIKDKWFGKTIIHSDKRFTYKEAQDVLDEKDGVFIDELTKIRDLAKKIRVKRMKEGAISFEQDEVKFKLNEKGMPIDVVVKERLETNLLIEDFMLMANKGVAEFIFELCKAQGLGTPTFIYRIHDVPKNEKIAELEIFLRAIGYDIKTKKGEMSSKEINKLLESIKGKPEEKLIQMATIRSMAKAIYSTKNIGHFSLSFRHYTHFTSPIRRYPDMMAHRIFFGHLDKSPIPNDELKRYSNLAIKSSQREIEAVAAERESIKYKQVEYMKEHIGEKFNGLITGVTDFGIFIEERKTKAEGLVRLADMDDYYELEKGGYSLVGKKGRKRYAVGDEVKIELLDADLDERRISWKILQK
ncbi:MAG: ribonuclease R [Candidatus Pacebacteria bacterium]|nr:ribonuclease R [Candidatus Paceibacterota bacterium]